MTNESIIVLGSSGSVGTQALDVARAHNIPVEALTGGKNAVLLEEQIREFHPRAVAMADADAAKELAVRVADTETRVLSGTEGILEVIGTATSKTAVNSILGLAGLAPTLAAAKRGMRIAIANKESLVAAGELVKDAVRKNGAELPCGQRTQRHLSMSACRQKGRGQAPLAHSIGRPVLRLYGRRA